MLYFYSIGACGPSLSAIILASRGKSKSIYNSNKKKWLTFIMIYIFGLISAFAGLVQYPNFTTITLFIIFILSLIPAYWISGMYSVNSGIRSLLKTLKGVKKKNIYLFFAFIIPLLVNLRSIIIYLILGRNVPPNTNISVEFVISFFYCFWRTCK